MSIVMHAAALMLPLLHPTLPAVAENLHPAPITVSGVACASAHDMAGLYVINTHNKIKTADDLLALGKQAGFRCLMLHNASVINWGQVSAPDATITGPGGKIVPIVEVVEPGDSPDREHYLIAKTQ